ncbi:MAG: sulfotransferase [Pseudomonadota bacterium]
MSITVTNAEIADLQARHEEVFRPPFLRRYGLLLAFAFCAFYSVYCWWFFGVGKVLERANWGIAGTYLADWVSYEVRPDVEFEDGYLEITYPRFSPLGDNPDPDWIVTKRILINGLGRSGTSWVQKVFDHHPSVLAIHEPDLVYRFGDVITEKTVGEMAEKYFSRRPLRAMRKRPILRKPYRSNAAHHLRNTYMYGASMVSTLLPEAKRPFVQVPDFTGRPGPSHTVVKTVTRQSYAPEFAQSNPDMKVIYVVRHPCGYVASQSKGMNSGKMTPVYLPPREELARLYSFDGRTADELHEEDFTELEIMAYRWSVLNDVVLRKIDGRENMRVVLYEDLCAHPREAFADLLEWCGLDWAEECDAFIARSLDQDGDADGYHDLVRNPLTAATRWSTTLPKDDQKQVISIAKESCAFGLFQGPDAPRSIPQSMVT